MTVVVGAALNGVAAESLATTISAVVLSPIHLIIQLRVISEAPEIMKAAIAVAVAAATVAVAIVTAAAAAIVVAVIATAAVENLLGGPHAVAMCRKPEIVADAAWHIMTRNSREFSGNFLIDEDVLRDAGVTDFDQYAVEPGTSLMPDFFLGEPDLAALQKLLHAESSGDQRAD